MINQKIYPSYHSRKLLQTNSSSSSSFDASQPSFIALLCIISVLTFAFIITVIVLCYRYYSHREKQTKKRSKRRKQFQRISSTDNNKNNNHHPQSTIPTSITPTSFSSYSGRSSEQLMPNRYHQTSLNNTYPSRRLQQSIVDAYLNDINTCQPRTIDVNQLNSYLFIDLHSTSSETYPNRTLTSDYNTSTDDENQRKTPHQRRSKQFPNSRFLMRERILPNHLQQLPQLRQAITQQQKNLLGLNDTGSSTTIYNHDLQSTTTTTDDYDDSHAYHVNQNRIMDTIHEEKPISFDLQAFFNNEPEPYFFEVVSTSHDDYNDEYPIAKKCHRPMTNNHITYLDDSIIV